MPNGLRAPLPNSKPPDVGWLIVCVCVCVFLGLHPLHTEVPRIGVNWSYSCQLIPQPQQHRIWVIPVTYTTAHSNAGSLIHCMRPEIEPSFSWILVRFITTEPWWELPLICFNHHIYPCFYPNPSLHFYARLHIPHLIYNFFFFCLFAFF